MQIQELNLTDREKSTIKYKIIEFSDGEIQLELEPFDRKSEIVNIVTRISSMNDLFILQQAADIFNRQEVSFNIYILYLMGMRMDRVMSFERPYTLKIIANSINAMKPKNVYVVEPHSNKTIELINNCNKIEIQTIKDFKKDYTIIYPDNGAKDRYASAGFTEITDLFVNIFSPSIYCEKVQDVETGKLLSFNIVNVEELKNSNKEKAIIFDDLCDGGGTFLGIAAEIKKVRPDLKLAIAVTHAVNKKGIDNLLNTFDEVYITDSYKDWSQIYTNEEKLHITHITL